MHDIGETVTVVEPASVYLFDRTNAKLTKLYTGRPDLVGAPLVPMWPVEIKSRDGLVHRVQPGNHMGQNDGRITAVHEDRIEMVELVPDGAGGWLERPATVALDDQ